MSISNDLDEITECIVCPKCKKNSPKDWTVRRLEQRNGKRKIRKSKVYFRCVLCNHDTQIFDKELIKFMDRELMMGDDFDYYNRHL